MDRSQKEIGWLEEGEMERSGTVKGQGDEESKCKGRQWGEREQHVPIVPSTTCTLRSMPLFFNKLQLYTTLQKICKEFTLFLS